MSCFTKPWIRHIIINLCFFCHQRFLPSEFGIDVDRHNTVEPVISFFDKKVKIRRTIEAEEIPYTYVSSNAFAGYFLPTLGQQDVTAPPRDKVTILGDGNVAGHNNEPNYLLLFLYKWNTTIELSELCICNVCFRCLCVGGRRWDLHH